MLGKDLFKVEVKADLSYRRNKSLILFYNPLIGNDAYYLYEFLCLKGTSSNFEELNKLLNSTRLSIDNFEECLKKLNKYGLLTTLKKKEEEQKEDSNRYIFILENPLDFDEFSKDALLVRDFILKAGGQYYQMLISETRSFSKHRGFDDVSYKFDLKELESWNLNDEQFLKPLGNIDKSYDFNTMFDVNILLEDMSLNLLPMKFRTSENLKEIARLADIYNISYDKMRIIISKTLRSDSKSLDLKELKNRCIAALPDYRVIEKGNYKVPCELFLMNKQDGKEVTPFDKKILNDLSLKYHLTPEVINVLIEYTLNNCENHLIEKYMYSIASDFHRNGIDDYQSALKSLNGSTSKAKKETKKDIKVVYDNSNNKDVSKEELEALRKYRGNNAK